MLVPEYRIITLARKCSTFFPIVISTFQEEYMQKTRMRFKWTSQFRGCDGEDEPEILVLALGEDH